MEVSKDLQLKDKTWNHTEIRRKVIFCKLGNNSVTSKSLKDFTNHKNKTIMAAVFSQRSLPNILTGFLTI